MGNFASSSSSAKKQSNVQDQGGGEPVVVRGGKGLGKYDSAGHVAFRAMLDEKLSDYFGASTREEREEVIAEVLARFIFESEGGRRLSEYQAKEKIKYMFIHRKNKADAGGSPRRAAKQRKSAPVPPPSRGQGPVTTSPTKPAASTWFWGSGAAAKPQEEEEEQQRRVVVRCGRGQTGPGNTLYQEEMAAKRGDYLDAEPNSREREQIVHHFLAHFAYVHGDTDEPLSEHEARSKVCKSLSRRNPPAAVAAQRTSGATSPTKPAASAWFWRWGAAAKPQEEEQQRRAIVRCGPGHHYMPGNISYQEEMAAQRGNFLHAAPHSQEREEIIQHFLTHFAYVHSDTDEPLSEHEARSKVRKSLLDFRQQQRRSPPAAAAQGTSSGHRRRHPSHSHRKSARTTAGKKRHREEIES